MLDLSHPIEGLRPAAYNPRAITADALEKLKASIALLGFCKPIIVTTAGLIVAGHQRTKAATAMGLTHVPAWVLPAEKLVKDDEVAFNQLHNGTDTEIAEEPVWLPAAPESDLARFTELPPKAVTGNHRMAGAPIRGLIEQLLGRYGNWGGCVATLSGRVVSSPHYALAAASTGTTLRVWRIKDEDAEQATRAFQHQYGEFSYEHIHRDTFNQTLAQLFRLREGRGLAMSRRGSPLYMNHIIPDLKPGERLLDFACGQGDHVKALQKQGVRAFGLEFFFRNGARLDYRAVHRMIDAMLAHWARYGGFDVVLADAVMNSVDSLTAESDVLTCVQTFCRPGGRLYLSGRERTASDRAVEARVFTTKTAVRRKVEFLDKDGFTAYQRGDFWFFQKFHTVSEITGLILKHQFHTPHVYAANSMFRVIATKQTPLPDAQVEASLRREFSLPWPGGASVNRADEAVAAWKAAKLVDAARAAVTAGAQTVA